jgi:hypothetical protein
MHPSLLPGKPKVSCTTCPFLLRLNNDWAHTYNHNTDDNTEKNQTDWVCIFQKIKGVLLGRIKIALK